MNIYMIVRKVNVCHGHGDYGNEFHVGCPAYSDKPYPVFKTKTAAENYIKVNKIWHPEILELTLQ